MPPCTLHCLNEPLAREANREDCCTGRFWAKLAETPEGSEYTSLNQRIMKAKTPTKPNQSEKETDITRTNQITPKGLLPYAGTENMNSHKSALPYYFLYYLALVDWAGRAVRETEDRGKSEGRRRGTHRPPTMKPSDDCSVMRAEWTDPPLYALEGIRDYIDRDSPYYAQRFIERIFDVAGKLQDHPKMGRTIPEAARDDVRELIYQGYRIK